MGPHVDNLIDTLHVVLKVVLLVRVKHVTAVAHGAFSNTSCLEDGLDSNLELLHVVEGIKDAEDIHAALLCLLAEVGNGIVGQRRVSDTVGTTKQHLERNVGHKLPHLLQSLPGILVEETHGDIKGGTAPTFQCPRVAEGVTGLLGNVEQIDRSDSGGKKRLMRVSPRGVHDQAALVRSDGLGKGSRTFLGNDAPPALGAGHFEIDGLAGSVVENGHDDVALELGLTNLTLDLTPVDGKVSEVCEKLLSAVLRADESEELRSVIDKGRPAVSADEGGVSKKGSEERNVGLDTANPELDEGAKHLPPDNLIGGSVARALDEHRVVVGGNDCASETVTSVKTDSVATSRAVDFELASVGREALGRIFRGDTTLDGETADGDTILGQAELLERCASGDLDLGGNNIDAGDLFGDGVLDLDSGVDLNEVVPVLLVDQELCGTGVAVVDRPGELDGIGQDGVAGLDWEILCGSKLDHFLVTSLNRAVTLVQVDHVAVAVTEELDFNVLGLVEEALDEDGAVAKGRLGFGSGALEGILELFLRADNTHTTATTAKGSLDDDGEAVLVSELLDLFELLDGALGTGHDGNTALGGEGTGGDLVTEGVDCLRGRSNELVTSVSYGC